MVGVDDIGSFGTFDASGAFMSKDVSLAFTSDNCFHSTFSLLSMNICLHYIKCHTDVSYVCWCRINP